MRSSRLRLIGWLAVAIGLVALGLWVVLAAATGTSDFERWVGWANILALPVGAIGTALVIYDRARRGPDAGREPPDPVNMPPASYTQIISAAHGGFAQGAQGPDTRVVNHGPQPPAASEPDGHERRRGGD
ncbi:hypothetical protein GCM10010112_63240 [Actinoplanes lobatus]|nr:hypothetical protein GCM10010112_63240 [Actinoplanes lobatus]GIE44102.1 hypothetical protein Alo02nite_70000 [Actinoplanes lobatus]